MNEKTKYDFWNTPIPTLYADGVTDDTFALQSWIDGRPVHDADGNLLPDMDLDLEGKDVFIGGILYCSGLYDDGKVGDRILRNGNFYYIPKDRDSVFKGEFTVMDALDQTSSTHEG